MNSKQCPSCGSTNLYQESATIYRCGDCFDKVPTGGMVDLPPPKVYGTSKDKSQTSSFGNWKNLISAIVVAWIVLGSSAFTYYQKLQSNLNLSQEEEVESISMEPNSGTIEIVPAGEFQYTSALPDIIGNVYIVGKFTNQSGHQLLMPKFTVDLLNEEGASVGSNFGYAEKNVVSDGEALIFQVLVEKAPSYSKFDINVSAATIPNTTSQPTLSLKQIDFKRNQYKEIILTGKIQNKGNSTTNFTRITCLLINKEEKTFDYGTISLEKEDFLPKESQYFEIIFPRAKQVPNSYYCETDAILKENTSN